jgi:Trk K+ transport system NAD-binding subunit
LATSVQDRGEVGHALDHQVAEDDVLADHELLLEREVARLAEDGVRHGDLADVVELAGDVERLQEVAAEPEELPNRHRVVRDEVEWTLV